ncbi:MAG: carboxylating nicotinate-nucleotide diphosphorylase [Akkermansiaceae bacterium]|nr:carboxylating nicotinate-nucleotide diphosphorylase [Akkermansiaceae bacterium]
MQTNEVSDNRAELIRLALAEDFGSGDVTSLYFVPEGLTARALMRPRKRGVLSGVEVAAEVFKAVDPALKVDVCLHDGEEVSTDAVIMVIEGSARSILGAERTALNFIQRLSGVATMTRRYVRAIEHTSCKLLDTRKTTPGYRLLEKAAVVHGGGNNHRLGLYDRAMVKDNHLMTDGNVEHLQACITRLKQERPGVEVELEADHLAQVEAFLKLEGVDYILLDNMSPEQMRAAIALRGERAKPYFEASGGLTLETAPAAAESGVDFMSFGCLTHSVPSLDIGLDFTTLPSC